MAGPWEKYQQAAPAAQEGPWSRYAATSAPVAASEPVAPPARSTGQELARQAGLTGRHLIEGASQAVGLFSDPIAGLVNTVRPGTMDSAATVGRSVADSLGLPQPEGGVERVVGGVSRGIVGAGLFAGGGGAVAGAPGLVGGTGRILAANPGSQGVAAVTGSGASELTREAGGGPLAQLGAGLAGALAPATAGASLRGMLRGGASGLEKLTGNIRDFTRSGAGAPTVGQAAESRVGQGLDALLGKTPGSAGVLAKLSGAQQAGMGAKVREVADGLSLRADPTQAGRAIERGITGTNGYMARFKEAGRKLYDEVDAFIPPTTGVSIARTKAALDSLAAPTQGATETSRVLSSGRISQIRDALTRDLAASTRGPFAGAGAPAQAALPYEAVKGLRSRLGELIGDSALAPDLPTRQLKAVYAALSDDLAAAAAATGNPEAVKAAARANAFYKAGMERLEVLESVITKNGGPERIFAAAVSNTREGGTTFHTVMQSLPKEGQQQLMAAVVRRLGLAKPGQQNELGDVFSAETFLSNYNNLSSVAKRTLFGRMPDKYQADLEAVARVAANMREGAKVFSNPSNTSGATLQLGTGLSVVLSVVGGNLPLAGSIAAVPVAANAASRAITSPTVVSWLAKQSRLPAAVLPQQIALLKAEAQAKNDPDALEFARALEEQANGQQRNAGQ
jgi:hypothetical protein